MRIGFGLAGAGGLGLMAGPDGVGLADDVLEADGDGSAALAGDLDGGVRAVAFGRF